MKLEMLIANEDIDYTEHLSKTLLENHDDLFDLNICYSHNKLCDINKKFDVALVSPSMFNLLTDKKIALTIVLCETNDDFNEDCIKIQKYQRISKLCQQILAQYSQISTEKKNFSEQKSKVNLFWSPMGGTGKTTIALAYTTQLAAKGKKAVYLNLENFSSLPAFLNIEGESISSAFEGLDNNFNLLLKSIQQKDIETGIYYFNPPKNYDDINILSEDDITKLVDSASKDVDELIIDISSNCNLNTKIFMNLADKIFVILTKNSICTAKYKQFTSQNNVYEDIKDKILIVNNKSSNVKAETVFSLPNIQADDPKIVYKQLATIAF